MIYRTSKITKKSRCIYTVLGMCSFRRLSYKGERTRGHRSFNDSFKHQYDHSHVGHRRRVLLDAPKGNHHYPLQHRHLISCFHHHSSLAYPICALYSNHKLNQLVLLPRHFPAVNVEKHRNGNKDTEFAIET